MIQILIATGWIVAVIELIIIFGLIIFKLIED